MIAQCLNGPVQVGDMVRVVLPAPCCGDRAAIGTEYRVKMIAVGTGKCRFCARMARVVGVLDVSHEGNVPGTLIRLDPPTLPESIETEREVTA